MRPNNAFFLHMYLILLLQEYLYDSKSHKGYLESYIRNKRSRDPEVTTLWTCRKNRFISIQTACILIKRVQIQYFDLLRY